MTSSSSPSLVTSLTDIGGTTTILDSNKQHCDLDSSTVVIATASSLRHTTQSPYLELTSGGNNATNGNRSLTHTPYYSNSASSSSSSPINTIGGGEGSIRSVNSKSSDVKMPLIPNQNSTNLSSYLGKHIPFSIL